MTRFNQRLNGLNPLAYIGDNSYQPPEFVTYSRAPTAQDFQNFELGTIWLDVSGYPTTIPTNEDIYMLVGLVGAQATWVNFGGGDLETLTSNSGGAVSPDGADNINVVGDGTGITGVGNPGTNTITFSLIGGGIAAQSFPTGAGVSTTSGTTAVPDAAGVLNVLGAHNVLTGGAVANTITVFGTNAITLGDLANIAAGSDAITINTGNITLSATNNVGNINLPQTHSSGNAGRLFIGGSQMLSRYSGGTPGSNIFVGNSGNLTNTADNNVALGGNSMIALTTGTLNVSVGGGSLTALTTGGDNTAIGDKTLNALTTGGRNTALGSQAGLNLITGQRNVLLGDDAALGYVGAESFNIIIGASAAGKAAETNAIRIGSGAGGDSAIFIGGGSGNTTYTSGVAQFNQCVGTNCLTALTTGAQNTAMGNAALQSVTTGNNNTAMGYVAGNMITTGEENTLIGDGAALLLTTGSDNVVVGAGSGGNYTSSESNNIIVGAAIAGTAAESDTTRIGSTTQQTRCFIGGIRGRTTGVNDAIAVLIDSAGQLGTISSSIRYKRNIRDIGDMSQKLYDLRPVKFQYKTDHDELDRYGLIAEEVNEVLPEMVIYNEEGDCETVRYNDILPLVLNELIALNKRIAKLEKRLV